MWEYDDVAKSGKMVKEEKQGNQLDQDKFLVMLKSLFNN